MKYRVIKTKAKCPFCKKIHESRTAIPIAQEPKRLMRNILCDKCIFQAFLKNNQ